MSIKRIDQFAASVAAGDGVTNSLIFTRDLLRELGYASDIFSYSIPTQLTGTVQHAGKFVDNRNTLMLYHHSMGHDHGAWLLSLKCLKALVYHNITPAHFFPEDSGLRQYAILGRQQLSDWHAHFSGAIAVSPLNQNELEASGYSNGKTIALLVDSQRLDGPTSRPSFLKAQAQDAIYYLCVGRLAENKRQHLLIEAFAHLIRMREGDNSPLRLLLVGGTTSEDYARALAHRVSQLNLQSHVLLPGKCSDAELRWLYRNAHQYWCASEHEGFCMPLVEAQHAGLPIIACAQSNIPATLGEGGLLLNVDDPLTFAAASCLLDKEQELPAHLVKAGKRNLERFDRRTLKEQLAAWIADLSQELVKAPT